MPLTSLHHNQDHPFIHLPFLPLIPDDYTLKRNRIDIWQYSLNTPYPNAALLLNETEQLRANRYHFPRHQRRFTIARALLRVILARYLNTNPCTLQFSENKYGKPTLDGSSVQFNISHSKDLALLAIGDTHPLGIDLEYFSARSFTGISKMMFSDTEINAFSRLPTTLRSLSFFHIWAQKEALIKACSLGLSYPTQQFNVPHLPPTHQLIFDPLHKKSWQMRSFMPTISCCGALCYHPEIQELRYQTLTQDHYELP